MLASFDNRGYPFLRICASKGMDLGPNIHHITSHDFLTMILVNQRGGPDSGSALCILTGCEPLSGPPARCAWPAKRKQTGVIPCRSIVKNCASKGRVSQILCH